MSRANFDAGENKNVSCVTRNIKFIANNRHGRQFSAVLTCVSHHGLDQYSMLSVALSGDRCYY
jgi:predicted component of type VI protein secretion system